MQQFGLPGPGRHPFERLVSHIILKQVLPIRQPLRTGRFSDPN